ncbi:CPBP family intramembrane glutamic endopeptidase [Marinitoga sp. 38H-ov]|uniref:CPBP family intramembrane glutamic endopeptidase n=1 Tax=Marinitoga sp. 38H-ov TaxID=1755814 RepID=UPI0013EA5324|nr:CPBP family intramembrane glutamic endopeptidase [Marinitoga sp. 38H-ov]KAF2956519.1 hypothetical protein AS160_05685 [Marinitoga sp. 38H-ov]
MILLFLNIVLYFFIIYLIERNIQFEKGLIIKSIIFLLLIPLYNLIIFIKIPYLIYLIFLIYGIIINILPDKWVKTNSLKFYINRKRLFLIPIAASITEEVFFRGILNELLLNELSNIMHVSIISSFLFALIHIFNLFNGLESKKYFVLTFPIRFAFGLFFSFLYFKYGIISAIFVHFLVDFSALLRIYKNTL